MSQVRFRLIVNQRTTIEGYATYTCEWGVYHHVDFTPTLVVHTTRQEGRKYRKPPEWLWEATPYSWRRRLHHLVVGNMVNSDPLPEVYRPEWVELTP